VTFKVVVLSPDGCAEFSVPISLAPCEETPEQCPIVNWNPVEFGACDDDGKRSVTISGEFQTGSAFDAVLKDDGGNVLLNIAGVDNSPFTHTEILPGGTPKTYFADITSPAICGGSSITVDPASCVCPEINLRANAIDKCDDNGNRQVAVTAEISSAQAYTVEIRHGDGTLLDTVEGTGNQTLNYSGFFQSGVEHTFKTVILNPPTNCDDVEISVDVPSCAESDTVPKPDPEPNPRTSVCAGLRMITVFTAAVTELLAVLYVCLGFVPKLGIIAAIAAVVTIVVGGLYWLFCKKPCGNKTKLLGQIQLVFGIFAVALSGCCPWMFPTGWGAIVLGLSFLVGWQQLCNISNCSLGGAVTTLAGLAMPIAVGLQYIPIVNACYNSAAIDALAAIFGMIAAATATCYAARELSD